MDQPQGDGWLEGAVQGGSSQELIADRCAGDEMGGRPPGRNKHCLQKESLSLCAGSESDGVDSISPEHTTSSDGPMERCVSLMLDAN